MTAVTVPLPLVVTDALAPLQLVVPSSNNLILWKVPLAVYPEPPADIPDISSMALREAKPCGLSNVIVATPTFADGKEVVTPVTLFPYPRSFTILSIVSLVILFLRSSVATSPNGFLFANDTADGGFESLFLYLIVDISQQHFVHT